MIGKKRKIGRKMSEISIGEKLSITETIEDKDLLIYLGLFNDSNPLYIQHDYASQTPLKKPIVPSIMINGIIHSAISKYLPGAGSRILEQNLTYPNPVYHYATIEILLTIIDKNEDKHEVTIHVEGHDEDDRIVVEGSITVCPPHEKEMMNGQALENF
ncbi:enoyl-CoA hydratase [Bacillus coahuilensis p1.1.43]|uniref:Enoyl-CoA hydratase n=1 Tax=Bacillus coahuilensis p1.1.43 TaxID=1150625 RepID=A0A147K6W8_9BACI|nr:MaoC/PaaZ C-terminal domain-containing protein [Bacillus coahuilensis]KUP05578.1 enoyl-CoA hydratase [Bacillus coahuilensis p1.1.43]